MRHPHPSKRRRLPAFRALALAWTLSLLVAPSTLAQLPEPEPEPEEPYEWVCVPSGGFVYLHRGLQMGFCELRLCWLEDEGGSVWPYGTLRALFPEYTCAPLVPSSPQEPAEPEIAR